MREEIAQLLADAEAEVRRRALLLAGDAPHEEARAVLFAGLADRDWRVRKEAAGLIAERLATLDAASELVAALAQGDNVGLRSAALEVFTRARSVPEPEMIEALSRVEPRARKFVIEALGEARGPAAFATLVAAAQDDDPNVIAAALDAIARAAADPGSTRPQGRSLPPGGTNPPRTRRSAPPPPLHSLPPGPNRALAVDAVRAHLRSPIAYLRVAALDALLRMDAKIALDDLEPALAEAASRSLALALIARSGDPRALPILRGALERPIRSVVATAALGLLRVSDGVDVATIEAALRGLPEEAKATLLKIATDPALEPRRAAVHVLVHVRDPACLTALVDLAADAALPPSTLDALVRYRGAIEPLLAIQADTAGARRAAALELASDVASYAAPEPKVLDALRAALRDAIEDESAVRIAACRCLARWAEPADVPALVDLAAGSSDEAQVAANALRVVASRARAAVDAAMDAVVLDTAGPALVRLVAELSGERALPRLEAVQSSPSVEARIAALEGIATFGGARAAELVAFALGDESSTVQAAAAAALGRITDPDGRGVAIAALRLALVADVPNVRAAAARALADARDVESTEALRRLLRAPQAGVVLAALEALRTLGDPELEVRLVELLGHFDPELVKEALRGIAAIRGEHVLRRLGLGLEHASWDVRSLAATLLGDLGRVDRGQRDEARELLYTRYQLETDAMVYATLERVLESFGTFDRLRSG